MKKNEKKFSKTSRILCILSVFVIALTICTTLNKSKETITLNSAEYAVNIDKDPDAIYLSDIDYTLAKSGWKTILMDVAGDGNKIAVKIENSVYTFDKGIWAHASSELVYDISAYSDQYRYFTAYLGINNSSNQGNGVKFYIYTSNDNKNWTLRTEENPSTTMPGTNSKFVKIDVKGIKYLRLVANDNGANGNDHSVYADAKLVKNLVEESNAVKSVEEYDQLIKTKYANETLENKEYELALLQRDFVSKVGQFAIRTFIKGGDKNKEAFEWLFNNVDNLRLYIVGGAPDGSYINSLYVLSDLYAKYKTDLENTQSLNNIYDNTLTYGDLYKKMMITLSLTHSTQVALWMQYSPENTSDPIRRYQIYKDLHLKSKNLKEGETGGFKAWEGMDFTPLFESLHVEEMRFVLNNIIDDQEIVWLNEFTQMHIDNETNNKGKYLTPHPYLRYVWPDYGDSRFHDTTKKDYWDKLYAVNGKGIFTYYGVQYIPGIYKLWMTLNKNDWESGSVCGGISKTGSNIRGAHGLPSSVISQPGHAALIHYNKNEQGQGYWTIDNDVSGWAQSGRTERLNLRMPLGWGDEEYIDRDKDWLGMATYVLLAQGALNDFENYQASRETLILADVYKNDLTKLEKIYRQVLASEPLNIDAWYGLIKTYKAQKRSQADFYELSKEIIANLTYYPLPMYHLEREIAKELTKTEYAFKFTLDQTAALNKAKDATNNETIQKQAVNQEANYLLGIFDSELATFSFDGTDAGKIVLSSRFDDTGIRFDYSIDGKKTWKEVSFTEKEPHKVTLTKDQIDSINSENDIYVHIVGVDYSEANLYKIDITEGTLPKFNNGDYLYGNDLENRVIGISTTMEWRYSGKDKWTSYAKSSPDLTGNKTVQVRSAATGTQMASDFATFTFTEDNQPSTRKYIPISSLSIHSYSTQSKDSNRPFYAPSAIDGNINTMWHTDFAIDVLKQPGKPFITIELDSPRYLSALEFAQTKYKYNDPDFIKTAIVYVSTDGETWKEAARLENIPLVSNQLSKIEFKQAEYAKYVKFEVETYDIFASVSMFNLYEDLTKNPHPTAGIAYSTTESTNGNVIARLVNPSTKIKITNNNGSDTHVFTENGEFTFEFEDEKGYKGSSTAKVDWIDKSIPTAKVDYELDNNKKLVILLGNISESVYLLDKNNKKVNYVEVNNNKVTSVSYINSANNVYKIIEVDEKGNTQNITYKNTTGKVTNVDTYVTTIEDGKITSESYFDKDGNVVTISESDKQYLEKLQETISNPLEYTFETSGNYEFKLQDAANNITTKNVRVDYIKSTTQNESVILGSDITYDITSLTNEDVTAVVNTYIIDTSKEEANIEMVESQSKEYKFTKNGEYTFKYKDSRDENNSNVRSNTARVNWIDKEKPTAEIKYTTDSTSKKVFATLTNESENITIINNSGNRTYTFTKNGEFTFEFQDAAGNINTLTAKVTSIEEETKHYCEVVNGKYYDKNGNIVDKTAYDKSCTTQPENKPSTQEPEDNKPTQQPENNGNSNMNTGTNNNVNSSNKPSTNNNTNNSVDKNNNNSNNTIEENKNNNSNNTVNNTTEDNKQNSTMDENTTNDKIKDNSKKTPIWYYIVPVFIIILIAYLITIVYKKQR